MQAFKGRVAIVTGSTGEGMGRSIALTLAREGAKVVLNYGTGHPNNVSAAEKVLGEIRSVGGKGYAFKADTREEEQIRDMIDGVITLYGRIDFLVCNAGGGWDAKDLPLVEGDQWRSVTRAEIDGMFYCIKYTLPFMREARFGRIIALGISGADRWSGPPFDYMLGKSARSAFIRAIAVEERRRGITCNVIAPGHIPHVTLKQALDAVKHSTAWRRRSHPTPQDVAEVVRFLCSEEAAFVTGSVIELESRSGG